MCLFCDIASGSVPADVVYEDEDALAFLDHRPVFLGHTLLIPREHFETLTDLPDRLIEPFFRAGRTLAEAVPSAVDATGTFVAMNNRVSQSVAHLHLHVVPRNPKDGLRGFFWPRHKYSSDAQRSEIAAAIRAAVAHD
jgi:histidine triad (HIT) family protein